MPLPKVGKKFRISLREKFFLIFIIVSAIPLIISNLIWFHFSSMQLPESLLFTLLSVFILFTLSVILASIWASNYMSDPINMLQKGIDAIIHGNLDSRVDIKTGDEIEDMSLEFNKMAATLKDTIGNITYQSKLSRAMRNIDQALMSTLEIEPLCQSIANLISHELGYVFGAIAIVDDKTNSLQRIAISRSGVSEKDKALQMILETIVPIGYDDQTVSLQNNENLLVRAVNERQSFYTQELYDIQKGLFSKEVSEKIQKSLRENQHDFKGIFVYPLIAKGKALGVIYYASGASKDDTEKIQFAIMDNFTVEVAKALENAQLYQDIKQDRSLISAERNKLSVILSGIRDGVISVDLNRRVVTLNKAAQELTGYKDEEAVGKPVSEIIKLYVGVKELLDTEYSPIRTDGFEGVVFSKKQIKMRGKDMQKEITVDVTAGQIKEGVAINLGCILTLHDVTEESELEEMKLDFVSMAAHELRTPLTSIRGYLSVFIEENRNKLNEEQNMFLNRINVSSQQLMGLIENLLNVSRIERGVFAVTLTTVDWLKIVNDTVILFKDRAAEKKIKLELINPGVSTIMIKADSLRINEVLSNLLSNAISYTSPEGTIVVSVEDKGTEVITHVKDTGEGIPKEAVPHLFTKFFRVAGKLAQGSKGTGLGLYISKAIVEMHHGKIWVESEPNVGSTFSFSLPKA